MRGTALVVASAVALAAVTACSRADLPFGSPGGGTPTPTSTLTPIPTPTPSTPADGVRVWNSWDAAFEGAGPPGFILDANGHLGAELTVHESTTTNGTTPGPELSQFVTTANTHPGNRIAGGFWEKPEASESMQVAYVGKSAVARGGDVGESNVPAPNGVFDLQLHPPSDGHSAIVHFVVPTAGTYSFADFKARLVDDSLCGDGVNVLYSLDGQGTGSNTVLPQLEQNAWKAIFTGPDVRILPAGAYVDIVVEPQGSYDCDATEVSFTITKSP